MSSKFQLARIACSLSVLTLLASSAAADRSSWLSDADIRSMLGGKTLEGRYATGTAFTESYLDNGRIEYFEGGRSIGGRWSVISNTLCTIYDSDPSGGCYRVTRVGENCFEFYFVSRTEEQAPGPPGSVPSWTARGAVSGKSSACHEGASV